ncbi:MAG: urea transporter, partial [Deltaproteobacteria bacterium]|nr:urea transporter [Deltaproteobacteria bacterium]
GAANEAPAAPVPRVPAWARDAVSTILASYSQVLFSRSPLVGALVMAATFVVPEVGIVGLLGVLVSSGVSLALGLDREGVTSGVLGYNALLVFLLVGALLDRSPAFWALSGALSMAVVLCHVALSSALHRHLRLPALSLPFVLVGWVALLAVPSIRGMAVRTSAPALALPAFPGPEALDTFLRSLGAIFFQPHWVAGTLVLVAMLLWSRIAVVHALVGFGVAVLAQDVLFSFPQGFVHSYVGFNFIMTAVALGGIFYVPGPASMVLAAAGSLVCGLVSVATLGVLAPVGLPVLALPFNATLLPVLYALGQRRAGARPRPVDFITGSPEDNLHYYRTRVARFRSELPVRMRLPVRGSWVVTQGNDGEHTHQGPWRHGLDLEVTGARGERHMGTGEQLADWLCYRLPVLAPAAGTVVQVVDGLPDTPIDAVDLENNWGNLVLIQHAPQVYSLLAHLSPGTLEVVPGQIVRAGQAVGRVGASGRSPVPHLHVQLQATPVLGDPTIPLEFHDVIASEGDGHVLHSRLLPVEDQRIANLTRCDGLPQLLDLPVGHRLMFEVTVDGVTQREEVVSQIDLLGARSLYSPSREARLWFDARGDCWVAVDHVGPRDGALFALYVALARLPLNERAEVTWTDHLNPRRLASNPLAWVRDALAAVLPPAEQPVDYSMSNTAGTVTITGAAEPAGSWQRAVRTEAVLRPGEGIARVRVQVGAQVLDVRGVTP